MTADSWMPYNDYIYNYMYNYVHARFDDVDLVQFHSGSAKAKNQCCMILSAIKRASMQLATTVGHFLRGLDLGFANVYIA